MPGTPSALKQSQALIIIIAISGIFPSQRQKRRMKRLQGPHHGRQEAVRDGLEGGGRRGEVVGG